MNSVSFDMLLKMWLSAGYSWYKCESIMKTWDEADKKIVKGLRYEGQGCCNKLIRDIKTKNGEV